MNTNPKDGEWFEVRRRTGDKLIDLIRWTGSGWQPRQPVHVLQTSSLQYLPDAYDDEYEWRPLPINLDEWHAYRDEWVSREEWIASIHGPWRQYYEKYPPENWPTRPDKRCKNARFGWW